MSPLTPRYEQDGRVPPELPEFSEPQPTKGGRRLSKRETEKAARLPQRMDLDPTYNAINRVDAHLRSLEREVRDRVGEGRTLDFVGEAREALYHASKAFAAEVTPRVTAALAAALARAQRRGER